MSNFVINMLKLFFVLSDYDPFGPTDPLPKKLIRSAMAKTQIQESVYLGKLCVLVGQA